MVVFFGSRLMGKVDAVPGLFHVATRFGHVNFVPLFPLQSYVVLSEQGTSFRGVPIPLSGKSVLIAWGRAAGLLTALIAGFAAAFVLSGPRGGEDGAQLLAVAGFGAALCAFLNFYKGVTRASFNRACHLGRLIGMNEQGIAEICRIYGRDGPVNGGGRGFEVMPPAEQGGGDAGYSGDSQQPPMQYAPPQYPPGYTPQYPPASPAVPVRPPGQATTFFVTGVNRATGEATCVAISADTADAAKVIGQGRGIDVKQVEYGGPKAR